MDSLIAVENSQTDSSASVVLRVACERVTASVPAVKAWQKVVPLSVRRTETSTWSSRGVTSTIWTWRAGL